MKDFKKVIRRDVDEKNRTVFVIENTDGVVESVLYSDVNMNKIIRQSDSQNRSSKVITKSTGERLVVRDTDENKETTINEFLATTNNDTLPLS